MASMPKTVTVIGGANLDVVGLPNSTPIPGESMPGRVTVSAGGVGRNVAENLARLGVATRLLTAVGEDADGERILADCRRAGVDVDAVRVVRDGETCRYLALLDEAGDLRLAVSQMDLVDRLDADYLDRHAALIAESSLVVVDANLPPRTIEALLHRCTGQPVFLEPVSAPKAARLKAFVGRFHTLKPNRAEAEVLTGREIGNEADLQRVLERFLRLGVQRVFISLGVAGLFFGDEQGSGLVRPPATRVVNATGAGDAAMAALAYCYSRGDSTEHSARFAVGAAALALSSDATVHPQMSETRVERLLRRP
ncbi:MAG: carbohydrate kinase family protein [Acidobacteriota bacterium]